MREHSLRTLIQIAANPQWQHGCGFMKLLQKENKGGRSQKMHLSKTMVGNSGK